MQMHRLALLRSINTNENDHGKGQYLMHTGRPQTPATVYPHLGSVMAKWLHGRGQPAARLHPHHARRRRQGVERGGLPRAQVQPALPRQRPAPRPTPRPIPRHLGARGRRAGRRCGMHANDRFARRRRTAETEAYTTTYEQALKLMARREVFDVSKEPARDLDRYGTHDFGRHCLLARRLLEVGRDVRPGQPLELRHPQRELRLPPRAGRRVRPVVRHPDRRPGRPRAARSTRSSS